jgi:anion-transporting  ArsA/GET3 family ATPase
VSTLDDLLGDRRVVVCVGAGGVGKTTSAAALAVAAARRGRRVVVVTIDPARRLADALGLGAASRRLGGGEGLTDDPRLVPGIGPGQLWGVMLDPQATFDALIRAQARSDEQVDRILSNPIYRNLTTSLSGTHEYLAAEKLHSLYHDPRFDLVVVDTPPAHHALDVLDGPGRLIRFLDHRLYRSVLGPRRGVMRAVNAATQSALRTTSRLVGADLVDDVIAFFAAFEGLDAGFRQRAAEVNRLLLGPDTGFVLVTSPRFQATRESEWLLGELGRRDVPVAALVVNRATPDFGPAPAVSEVPPRLRPARRAWEALATLAAAERAAIEDLHRDHGAVPLIVVDERERPVADVEGLGHLADQLTR